MNKKIVLAAVLVSALLCTGCMNKDKTKETVQVSNEQKEAVQVTPKAEQRVIPPKQLYHKAKLHVLQDDQDIPLSAVTQISGLPQNIRNIIEQQIKDSEVYYLNVQKDKVIILKDVADPEERCTRHDFEIINVSVSDGKVSKETKFPQKMSNKESDTEVWKYDVVDDDMVVPVSHTSFNDDGSIKTIESWFYGDDDLKYKVTDGDDKIISVRKTSKAENGNWRDEHVFYDENGKTVLNVSKVYENNNIARFTYYNPNSPETGAILVNEYDDTNKTKETVYSSDYKLKNSYTSVYKDGERAEIKVFDENNHEVAEYLTE